ncbi:response regulator [Kytococcus schroeteri]|uniref:response regulator n=1 Tax=Kytococcus schroeteri TaxID=138300 RepID=UPI001EE154AD|nr:response regulator transcription factor [Kytococcus schroeteri]
MSTSPSLRVVVADDSVLLREGLQLILADAGHQVVAGVGDGDAFVAAMAEHRPDLGIVDVRMPPTHTDEGLRATLAVRRADHSARVLVLSQYVVAGYVDELLAEDASGIGYLLKDRVADLRMLGESLQQVAAGGTVLDPDVVRQLLGRRPVADPVATLTPRERDVLELMAAGRTNAGIAEELVVTEGAVEKHTQRLFAKLGLSEGDHHRRVQAVLAWLRHTGIDLPD